MCYLYLMENAPTLIPTEVEPDGSILFDVVGFVNERGGQATIAVTVNELDTRNEFVAECIASGWFFPA